MNTPFRPAYALRTSLEAYLTTRKGHKRDLYKNLLENINGLKDAITAFMLSSKDDAVLKRYMRTFQNQLWDILNKIPLHWIDNLDVFGQLSQRKRGDRENYVCFLCYRYILELRLQYPAYFDPHLLVPFIYQEIELSNYHHKVLLIDTWFEKQDDKSREIWDIIKQWAQPFTGETDICFTYQQLQYYCELIDALMYHASLYIIQPSVVQLHLLLFHFNFNAVQFFNHMIVCIHEELNQHYIIREKINCLLQTRDTITAVPVRQDYILDNGAPGIIDQIRNFINAELSLLQA